MRFSTSLSGLGAEEWNRTCCLLPTRFGCGAVVVEDSAVLPTNDPVPAATLLVAAIAVVLERMTLREAAKDRFAIVVAFKCGRMTGHLLRFTKSLSTVVSF